MVRCCSYFHCFWYCCSCCCFYHTDFIVAATTAAAFAVFAAADDDLAVAFAKVPHVVPNAVPSTFCVAVTTFDFAVYNEQQ